MRTNLHHFVEYSNEVSAAIRNKKPILALESTLITHGLPYPHNIETALTLEAITREHDITPATIAILHGKIKIGLTEKELEILISDKEVNKASTRDLPYLLSKQLNAGTTVAATLFCAGLTQYIKVFATGGLGGVHRGDAYDISADLIELSRTPIAVVCSGVKSILDISKTLELLETLSIPVVGYQTKFFPAFYTRASSQSLTMHVNNIAELIQLIKIHHDIGVPSGMVITNPIAAEDEIPSEIIDPVITNALMIAEQQQIKGKAITPFLLDHIATVTQGKSLNANLKLIRNNVKLAAHLAKLL